MYCSITFCQGQPAIGRLQSSLAMASGPLDQWGDVMLDETAGFDDRPTNASRGRRRHGRGRPFRSSSYKHIRRARLVGRVYGELPLAVAAFPGPRLRHFQKQGSVKEELTRSGSPVQVELKSRRLFPSK